MIHLICDTAMARISPIAKARSVILRRGSAAKLAVPQRVLATARDPEQLPARARLAARRGAIIFHCAA